MTAQDVENWFQTFKNGYFKEHYQKFKGLKGSQLSKMTKDDFLRRSEQGDLIFNELQELKRSEKEIEGNLKFIF